MGATPNYARYANKAAHRLVYTGHKIVNIGNRRGEVAGVPIEKAEEIYEDIHTVTLYLNAKNQVPYYDYILKTHPKRLIFNPGAENSELKKLAEEAGIETVEGCTLVMLATNQY